jgi:hypothetical protein
LMGAAGAVAGASFDGLAVGLSSFEVVMARLILWIGVQRENICVPSWCGALCRMGVTTIRCAKGRDVDAVRKEEAADHPLAGSTPNIS